MPGISRAEQKNSPARSFAPAIGGPRKGNSGRGSRFQRRAGREGNKPREEQTGRVIASPSPSLIKIKPPGRPGERGLVGPAGRPADPSWIAGRGAGESLLPSGGSCGGHGGVEGSLRENTITSTIARSNGRTNELHFHAARTFAWTRSSAALVSRAFWPRGPKPCARRRSTLHRFRNWIDSREPSRNVASWLGSLPSDSRFRAREASVRHPCRSLAFNYPFAAFAAGVAVLAWGLCLDLRIAPATPGRR